MIGSSPSNESVRSRYAATLAGQLIQLASAAVAAGIVPRALGTAVYGNYSYLLNTATMLRGFLEPSAQQAFFTFSSQERRSGSLSKVYSVCLLVQLLLIGGIIATSAFFGIISKIWIDQRLNQIVLVTVLEWLTFLALTARQLGDSKGLTIYPQAISAIVSIVSVIALVTLFAFGWLDFYTYVWVSILGATISCAVLGYWLLVRHGDACWDGPLIGHARKYIRQWWTYAGPLVMVEYYIPIVVFMNVYFVQAWYGSVEQGYLALASRWSSVLLVFTNSGVMILWREIASAHAAGERERTAQIYLRFNQGLFAAALVLCCWLSLSGRILVSEIAGPQYSKAAPVLSVLAFYPLQQTYGQINTTVLKATGNTSRYRNICMGLSIPDLLLTYFLLAPRSSAVPGLGLGAMGVAVRLVGYGLLSVQVYEWYSFRLFGLRYGRYLLHKLVAAAVICACAAVLLGLCPRILEMCWSFPPLWSVAAMSGVYFVTVGAAFICWPNLVGLSRREVMHPLERIRALRRSVS